MPFLSELHQELRFQVRVVALLRWGTCRCHSCLASCRRCSSSPHPLLSAGMNSGSVQNPFRRVLHCFINRPAELSGIVRNAGGGCFSQVCTSSASSSLSACWNVVSDLLDALGHHSDGSRHVPETSVRRSSRCPLRSFERERLGQIARPSLQRSCAWVNPDSSQRTRRACCLWQCRTE